MTHGDPAVTSDLRTWLGCFWQENELCYGPFDTDKPRVPVSVRA